MSLHATDFQIQSVKMAREMTNVRRASSPQDDFLSFESRDPHQNARWNYRCFCQLWTQYGV